MTAVEDLPAPLRDGVDDAARLVYGRGLPDITDDEVHALPAAIDALLNAKRDEAAQIAYGRPWRWLSPLDQEFLGHELDCRTDENWQEIIRRMRGDRAQWSRGLEILKASADKPVWARDSLAIVWVQVGLDKGWL